MTKYLISFLGSARDIPDEEENQNHHLFVDRDGSGRTKWVVNEADNDTSGELWLTPLQLTSGRGRPLAG